MTRLGAALAAVVLLLTGCVRVTAETTLADDDTFSQHAVVAMTAQAASTLRQQLGSLPSDGADTLLDPAQLLDPDAVRAQLAPLEEAYPGSVDVRPYSDDQGRDGVEIDVRDIPIDVADQAAGAAPLATATSIRREGDAFVIEVATGAASQLRQAGAPVGDLGLIEGAVDVEVSFTFPGLVREASGGTIEGRTVTLGLTDLVASDTIRIVGGAGNQIDWGPWLRWGLVSLGALVLVGGATALVVQDRRRRSRSSLPLPRHGGEGGVGTLGDRQEPPADPPGADDPR